MHQLTLDLAELEFLDPNNIELVDLDGVEFLDPENFKFVESSNSDKSKISGGS